MKRRTFIGLVGASALAVPFTFSQLGSKFASGSARPTPKRLKSPLAVEFAPEELAVLSMLGNHARGVYLLGGCVVGRLAKHPTPCLNILVESKSFNKIKAALFEMGVTPISTPNLPGILARFTYADRSFSVINMSLDGFLQQSVLGQSLGFIPFAHNYLVYSVREKWVMDPYGALECKLASNGRFAIKLLQHPKTNLAGLEVCLAGSFDSALLGLEPSPEYAEMESRVLESQPADRAEALKVIEQVVNYFPDMVELCGLPFTRRYLLSPLCQGGARTGAGLDLGRVASILQGMSKRGRVISGAQFYRTLDFEFRRARSVKDPGMGLVNYVMAHGCPVRRTEALADSMDDSLRALTNNRV